MNVVKRYKFCSFFFWLKSTYYQFAVQSNNPKLAEETSTCIALSFSLVVETNRFLELGYECIAKILRSRGLNLSSQPDVLSQFMDQTKRFGA